VSTSHADVVVAGAGFGGLAAALTLADAGADVVLFEALKYPGGCASTFQRGGLDYEAGATLLTGFEPGQLFRRWVDRYALNLSYKTLDPVLVLDIGGRRRRLPARKQDWVEALVTEAGPRGRAVAAFFAEQDAAASALWSVLDTPELLPPLNLAAVAKHAGRVPGHLRWVRWMGQSLESVLTHYGVADFAPLRDWLEATTRITVQTSVQEAEAPFALAAADFLFRGVVEIDGGIGRLSWALIEAARKRGVDVRMPDAVQRLERVGSGWRVDARRGAVTARAVIANVLPSTVTSWVGHPVLPTLDRRVRTGWGAAMLYLAVVDAPDLNEDGRHHQLVDDPSAPLLDGNHALVSMGGPQVCDGRAVRTVSVSTHVQMSPDQADQATRVARAQERLRRQVRTRFPHWEVIREFTASPRTFERFTGRPGGYVGGVPRTVGLHHYGSAFSGAAEMGLHLVGDSVFPGQSTLAAATGGQRVATRVLGELRATA
jgi:phytoene dehydrogenase-like protein